MKFVWLEGGCFQMGQSPSEKKLLKKIAGDSDYEKYYADELPRHEVCVDPFWIGIHEVTQREWKKVMGYNPSHFSESDDFPVDMVSWDDAQTFINKLNETNKEGGFRLPTEAEWEFAARGGSDKMYHTGDSISTEQANYNGTFDFGLNTRGEYRKSSVKVGSFPANSYGIHDMHGNVWEWCNDWHDENYYKDSPKSNPAGPEKGAMRVLRGGSWFRFAGHIRSATRYKNKQPGQYADTGFRVVRSFRKLTKDPDTHNFNVDF
ncbi:MAG: formylglycine-generating enzyme family protein [Proteobacteria bacterium]|nr:formylglycine-generating enzyme family protein [Pseudomonadota bacterium]MBU1738727.1 formylglycine-generating enzyme family protein [Pseudomonadota bacterium]